MHVPLRVRVALVVSAATSLAAQLPVAPVAVLTDTDRDGLDDPEDSCPVLRYTPGFAWAACAPMDLNPDNDASPECKARERVARLMLQNGRFTTRIAFSVVKSGVLHTSSTPTMRPVP